MSKFIAEVVKMGFATPEPISTYYGYFDTEEKAHDYVKQNFKDFKFIPEDNFYMKDSGASVSEIYIQDADNESFLKNIENCKYLNKQYFDEKNMTKVGSENNEI